MSKKKEETLLRRILWGGVFLIGLGVILLADLPLPESVIILLGVVMLMDGLTRYYFERKGEGEKR